MFSCFSAMLFAFVVKPVLPHWWGWGELSAMVTHPPPVILSLCMLPQAFGYCTEGRSKHYRVSDSFFEWERERTGDGPKLQQDNSIRLCVCVCECGGGLSFRAGSEKVELKWGLALQCCCFGYRETCMEKDRTELISGALENFFAACSVYSYKWADATQFLNILFHCTEIYEMEVFLICLY